MTTAHPATAPPGRSRSSTGRPINGAAARAIRQLRGLNQDDVAHTIGISPGYLSRIETGRRAIDPAKAQQLADTLRVPLAVLTGQRPAIGILRLANRITDAEFAHDIDITIDDLARYERGSALPDATLAAVMANRLGVDPAALATHIDRVEAS